MFKCDKSNYSFIAYYSKNSQFTFIEEDETGVLCLGGATLDLKKIVQLYKSNNLETIINGHENTLIIIFSNVERGFIILTDRLNSKKAFYGTIGSNTFVTSNQKFLSRLNLALNPKAIAWYLTNGSLTRNQSIYQNFYQTRNAEIIKLLNGNIDISNYWQLKFNPVKATIEEYRDKMLQLLKKSVEASINNKISVNISLSGGYDISTILRIVYDSIDKDNIRCFTYYYKSIIGESDASIAVQQAKTLNIYIDTISSYNDDIIEFIKLNADWGDARANICNEIDFWNYLSKMYNSNIEEILFTGEEFFGWNKSKQRSPIKLLKTIGLNNSDNLKILGNIIPKKYLWIKKNTDDVFNEIVKETPAFSDSLDYQQYAYFHHNLPNVLLVWRELFAGRFFLPSVPWLNYELINFILQTPAELRDRKMLFKTTVETQFPDIFHIPRAKRGNNAPSWAFELLNSKDKILDLLKNSESLLDQLVNAEEIVKNYYTDSKYRKPIIDKLRRYNFKFSQRIPILGNIFGKIIGQPQLEVSTFILRLLTLRNFFLK
ncbi:MAG: hypothetical protein JXB49_28715 [Bacteroidales bacterium]|nr:hypothetical protein [Bacteroidales bacterium]